jgi:aryl-alcohol dehydrogenase-like predicted oxidoreductase
LGLAALGRPGYINLEHSQDLKATGYNVDAMRAQAFAVLDAAHAAGIRYFDAARSYGEGESFLADWLAARQLASSAVVIGSKWGYTYTADWQVDAAQHEVKAHTLPVLTRQWAESQALLGDHLDLYHIHSATLDSGVLDRVPVLEHLAQLKQQGTAMGLSLSGEKQGDTLRRALEISIDGVRLFDTVQATWNLLERSAGPALEMAHAAGLSVIVKEALANGRLTPRNQAPMFSAQRLAVAQQAQRLTCHFDALAIAAVLARPWVDMVLSGATTVAQLESNVSALAVTWDDEAEEALKDLSEATDVYWKRRSSLEWN